MRHRAMKTLTLALYAALTCAGLSQDVPARLRSLERVSVSGIVVSVSASQITVSNSTTFAQSTSQTRTYVQRGRFNDGTGIVTRSVTTPGRDVVIVKTTWTYLRNYPDWRKVRRGDRMDVSADNCYLLSGGKDGAYRTCEYFRSAGKRPVKVWN